MYKGQKVKVNYYGQIIESKIRSINGDYFTILVKDCPSRKIFKDVEILK